MWLWQTASANHCSDGRQQIQFLISKLCFHPPAPECIDPQPFLELMVQHGMPCR
jgi:hypothetical protein